MLIPEFSFDFQKCMHGSESVLSKGNVITLRQLDPKVMSHIWCAGFFLLIDTVTNEVPWVSRESVMRTYFVFNW